MPGEESSPRKPAEDRSDEKFSRPRWRFALIAACTVVVALLVIIVPTAVVLTRTDRLHPVCPAMDERERVDCHPEGKATRDRCEARGCCWSPPAAQGPPSCFYPTNHGYELDGEVAKTATGYRARLRRLKSPPTPYSDDVGTLEVLVEMQEEHRLHVKILDPSSARYEVPEAALRVPRPGEAVDNPLYDVTFTHRPFSIKVTRKSTGATIFDTSVGKLTFSDQFLSVSTRLASPNLYGLGEHVHRRYRHDLNWKTWPIFSRGASPKGNFDNLYGHHPFYMCLEDSDGNANGVFLLNSNAMEVTLQPPVTLVKSQIRDDILDMERVAMPTVTYRVIGGVLDFYMFLGPSPENVVQQYTEMIGRSIMPAYWGLGFQLSRWNYTNIDKLRTVVQRTRDTGIPFDVQYGDIDYMEDTKDFTYDAELYQGLPDLVQNLHDHGQKYIIILDPAIGNTNRRDGSPYLPYESGLQADVFVKNADGVTDLVGEVWPGTTVFPDFTKPDTVQWWGDHCESFHNVIPYDGLWIDMNEPKTFKNGSLTGCGDDMWNYPPYVPAIKGKLMYERTLCMDTLQYWGRHYDVHSLYGHSMAIATRSAMSRVFPDKRGIIITRANFVGTGQYSGHWLGDNKSAWEDMEWSITGMLEFGLFGIPYIGADICGFLLDTTEQLCQRWMQLGAFYPYSRNHNHNDFIDQDPAVFSQTMIDSSRDVMMTRYTLLPYLYTLFYHAHVAGTTVVRPLLHEFPTDSNTWDVDRQFLWGSGLLISPVLTPVGDLYACLKGGEMKTFGVKYLHVAVVVVADDDVVAAVDVHVEDGAQILLTLTFVSELQQDFAAGTEDENLVPDGDDDASQTVNSDAFCSFLCLFSPCHIDDTTSICLKSSRMERRNILSQYQYLEQIVRWIVLKSHDVHLLYHLQDTTTVDAYFPDTRWYYYFSGQEVEGQYRGQTVTLDAPLDKINVHVRGGVILPTQQPANTTVYSRRNPMGLLVAMDDSSAASGTLFWDDGESIDSVERRDYVLVNFNASSTELLCEVVNVPLGGPTAGHWAALRYDTVSVYGLALGAETPTVRAGPVNGPLQTVAASRVQYDQDNQILLLTGLNDMDLKITSSLRVTWGYR
ncbi:sucrase-isomaltase, intestinal-like [Branchiostoma floridae]|uniref:alpha-glucosidase n=1 Tax=Branchiostoma floridae TaxID=7739 RepID=A0A9J7M315_BRAFL|nr:sucrase-isomaltase, intestinal-like [Branchiostoma floridae]